MNDEVKTTVEPDLLQDRIFVVALIPVLTDAFGSAKDLYHRLRQKPRSDSNNDESEASTQKPSKDRRDSHSNLSDTLRHHIRWSLDRREMHRSDSEDELLCTASSQTKATYDRGYQKLGEIYARGDGIAKIQLQSHIIKLQQVLIRIHHDLMLSNYLAVSSSHSQLIHLVQTVRITRAAAIQTLDLLYQRLLATSPQTSPKPHLPIPGKNPMPPRSRRSSSSSSSDANIPTPSQPPIKPNPNMRKLFCHYALQLQGHNNLPLSINFRVSGNNRCPSCYTHISIRPSKAWEVIVDSNGLQRRSNRFLVRNRFVVKCHRERGGFACVLCAAYGDADTVCRSIGALMEHLWKDHKSGDMKRDLDITES